MTDVLVLNSGFIPATNMTNKDSIKKTFFKMVEEKCSSDMYTHLEKIRIMRERVID